MSGAGFAVLYRFRVRQGSEADFAVDWAVVTRWLRDHRGGLGSRLHRAEDGTLVAYAQWPSSAARDAAFAAGDHNTPSEVVQARAGMRAVLTAPTTEERLMPLADELALVPAAL